MLYVFTGDREQARAKLRTVRDALLKKRPGAELFNIDADSLPEHDLRIFTTSQGLFERKYIVTLDSVFTEGGEDPALVERLAQSENAFLVFEQKPPKKLRDIFTKQAEDVFEFAEQRLQQKEFSAFALADALGSRDKKKLWILFREAISRHYAMNEIHGILFWQAKMIMLAHNSSSAAEAGVKQFPYSKAQRFTKQFSPEETHALLSELTNALLESRSKNIPLEHTLERIILDL